MPVDIETTVRESLARVLPPEVTAETIDPDEDMVEGYGLTSMNKVLFLMAACDDTGVSPDAFTEPDVARMRTLRDVTTALARNTGAVA